MLNINLYEFAKKFNSTKQPADSGDVFTGEFKNSSSMLSPVVALYRGPAGTAAPVNKNYAYIAEFDRYYFVRDWVFEGGLWVAYMECDLLATWKYRIGHSEFYVLRSSVLSLHDPYLQDNAWLNSVRNTSYNVYDFSFWDAEGVSNGNFVVGVVSDNTQGFGMTTYYTLTETQFRSLGTALFADLDLGDLGTTTEDLAKALVNPAEYITSCQWVPFYYSGGTIPQSIKVGTWYLPTVVGRVITDDPIYRVTKTITLPKHPQSGYGEYMNCSPYTSYTLELEPWGSVQLEPSLFIDCDSVTLIVDVDLVSGAGRLLITGSSDGEDVNGARMYAGVAKVGVDIAITSMQWTPAAATGVAIAKDVASMFGGFGAAASAIGDAVASVGTQKSVKGADGSMMILTNTAVLKAQFFYQTERDIEHRGLPCGKNVVPADVDSGYYLVMDGEIEAPASSEELQSIKGVLESGFFYE